MYQRITDENPYEKPMRIYPAVHYTMGGLWVDYNLMSTIPGLHVAGEANFSDHGANRLGASALMQGLADGYFVLPYTIGDYIASNKLEKLDTTHQEFRAAEESVRAPQSLSCRFAASAPSIPFTRNLARSCGITAAWRGHAKASPKRSSCCQRCVRSSGAT
jgi:succinate dehydrogenase / fumarate reductase flavoprotein subunit